MFTFSFWGEEGINLKKPGKEIERPVAENRCAITLFLLQCV
jgi:hypothetical protein